MSTLRDFEKYVTWNEKLQMYVPELWRRNILPSWLTFELTDTALPFGVAAAGAVTRPISFKQPYSSVEGLDDNLGTPFEVRSLVYEDSTDTTAAANFTVRLQEIGETRQFMNQPVHIRTICGSAQQPALLHEPYFLLSQHNIQAQFNKIAGGATNIRMYLVGAQYFPWDPGLLRYRSAKAKLTDEIRKWMNRRKYVSPYWLTTDLPVNLLAGATGNFRAKVGEDGHFEVFGMSVVATGNFGIEISETKTKQTLMNGQITLVNGVGTVFFPTIFTTPYLVPAGHFLNFNITDLSAAPNTLWLTLFGRKIYAPIRDVQDVLKETAVPTPADSPTQIVPRPL